MKSMVHTIVLMDLTRMDAGARQGIYFKPHI